MEQIRSFILNFLGVTPKLLEKVSPAQRELLEIFPIIFIAAIILGTVAYILADRREEEEGKELGELDREIGLIRELQRKRL